MESWWTNEFGPRKVGSFEEFLPALNVIGEPGAFPLVDSPGVTVSVIACPQSAPSLESIFSNPVWLNCDRLTARPSEGPYRQLQARESLGLRVASQSSKTRPFLIKAAARLPLAGDTVGKPLFWGATPLEPIRYGHSLTFCKSTLTIWACLAPSKA